MAGVSQKAVANYDEIALQENKQEELKRSRVSLDNEISINIDSCSRIHDEIRQARFYGD